MVLLVTLLTQPAGNGFTPEFVMTRMIPGTAIGVLVGDLVYTWMAFRLARRTGRTDVTAMPLGLDTPSTFGIPLLILLPALVDGREKLGLDHDQAMLYAWHVGLTVLVLSGVFKVLCAPFGNLVRRLVPRAGLLGSLAAIALALIAFLPLVNDIATVPLVGLVSLTVILVTLVAHRALPGNVPGALVAVVLGVLLYFALDQFGRQWGFALVPPRHAADVPAWSPSLLVPGFGEGADWWARVVTAALVKMPIALPFALATIVGGIDCTESAHAAGDEYDTRAVLLTEGVASVLAGCLGGVNQTTPYIGQPAYKKMGGRAAYTLATALFVGALGYFGWFQHLHAWLPEAAMFPILVFVGLEITAQSFQATPGKHYPAVAFAMLPALAYLAVLVVKMSGGAPSQSLLCLANGFIVTSMLWGAALAKVLDGRLLAAALYLLVCAVAAYFGVIHSPLLSEKIGLPWHILEEAKETVRYQTPMHWAGAYGLAAGLLVGLSFFPERRSSEPRLSGSGDGQLAP
jgi:AGZA family xanthine/uracil permease-like MFS transporter